MLHIKLKGITNAATCSQIFCLQTHNTPLTLGLGSKGQYSTFSEHGHVAYQIKGNHKCANIVHSKYFARRHTPPSPWVGGQKSTFSEHCHVAYQTKGNHEMQQHGHTMVEIVQISLFFIELTNEN